MKKQIEISFSDEAKEVYDSLKEKSQFSKTDSMLLNAIDQKIALIKSNIFYGDIIPKKLIPEEYKEHYSVTTLLRVELPCFWRMLYSAGDSEDEIVIVAFIIEILNHKEYDRRFGYKKR